jgi:tetratricopeptide (TPR) repeat protein
MTDPKDPKNTREHEPSTHAPSAGHSGRPGSIGAELGVSEQDFSAEALIESALGEYVPEPAVPDTEPSPEPTAPSEPLAPKPAVAAESVSRVPPPLPKRAPKPPLPPRPLPPRPPAPPIRSRTVSASLPRTPDPSADSPPGAPPVEPLAPTRTPGLPSVVPRSAVTGPQPPRVSPRLPTPSLGSSPPAAPLPSSPPLAPLPSSPPLAPLPSSPPLAPLPSSPPFATLPSSPPFAPVAEDSDEETRIVMRDDDERPTHVVPFADSSVEVSTESLPPELETLEGSPSWLEDPHDGLESLPPPGTDPPPPKPFPHPMPSAVAAPRSWHEERPAAAHLAEQNARGDWMARAEWLENEAATTEDPQARARLLVVASELWAMAGDLARAHDAARRANTAAPANALVGRQLRWLCALERDFRSVAAALEVETRASPSAEARIHAAWLSSEVSRLVLDDSAVAQKKWELALRVLPSDPRAPLMKLGQALGPSAKPKELRLPEAPELRVLSRAATDLAAMRGADAPDREPPTPIVAYEQARRAISSGDRARAADALAVLAGVAGLERAALWLGASLLAPERETRDRAITLLGALLRGQRSREAVRALVTRTLEQGEAEKIREALERDGESEIFAPADRVALGLLVGSEHEAFRPWLDRLPAGMRPLATAALGSVVAPTGNLDIASGNDRSRAEVALGRALGDRTPSSLETAFASYMEACPDSPLGPALALELAVAQRDGRSVATELRQLGLGDDAPLEAERDRSLAAALVDEVSNSPEEAARAYTSAVGADPAHEAAARAIMAHGDAVAASSMLVTLSEQVADETQRALLLVEAALRRGPRDNDHFPEWIERAIEANPGLPFAYRMGEQLARAKGDVVELVSWLKRRRDMATDPLESSLDLTREALLVADTDIERARGLLEEATRARPEDVALRELFERLSPGAGAEKGAWREAAAASAKSSKLPLLLDATVEYERAGDLASAARVALAAYEFGDSEFAAVLAERLGGTGAGAARLSEKLFARARSEDDPVTQRELYERLSRLDRERGDQASALLWLSAILERTPGYLPALRRLEQFYIGSARDAELEGVAAALASRLDGGEAVAHAMLAARLRARSRGWSEARELVQIAARQPNRPLAVLRQLAAYGRFYQDDTELVTVYQDLAERVNHVLDVATLALRAAEASVRNGQMDEAKSLLERSLDVVPHHPISLTTQAEVLEATGNFEAAAEALEALAQVSRVDAYKLGAWHQAAVLWMDKVQDKKRSVIALERAADLDITHEDVFARLQTLYVASQDRARLADLLQRRLDRTTDPGERTSLEVTRGRALAEVGDRGAAKAALTAALAADPDHAEALQAMAELCLAEEDWSGAEQAWLRLATRAPLPEEQANIYRRLADLYDTKLDQPARAELAFLELLKRQPDSAEAAEKLVKLYTRLGNAERAIELANGLLERAASPEEKRDRTIELARVHEVGAHDPKQAESMLDKARKAWPQDGKVLSALVEFHQRQGDARAAQLLLDRSTMDARRALNTGRFEPQLFGLLGAVAELRGSLDAARVARATHQALEGQPSPLDGAGAEAAEPSLDELLAPELVTLPLRALLRGLGSTLDALAPVDLDRLRAGPLPAEAEAFGVRVAEMAAAFGLGPIEAFVSSAPGLVCLPASVVPPRLVFGSRLIEAPEDPVTSFLVIRCLKVLAAHAAALSRAAPVELWPMIAGLLSTLVPNWQPQAVDAKRLDDAQARLAGLITDPPAELMAAALEVTGSIGNHGSQLGTAVNQWGNRVALLSIGDPSVALGAIALNLGTTAGLPASGLDRVKWIARNPETRDLAVFSVSDAYAEARRRVHADDQ